MNRSIASQNWYYRHYDRVFAFNRDYREEIALLHTLCALKDKHVIELGAGTGNHATEIIKCEPSRLSLFDSSYEAVHILANRFKSLPNIVIQQADVSLNGFDGHCLGDITLIMFSLVQQTRDPRVCISRISQLFSRMKYGARLVLEMVDIQKSEKIYGGKPPTCIYSDDLFHAFIQSEYFERFARIRYDLKDRSEYYFHDVFLARISPSDVQEGIRSLGKIIDMAPLSPDSRRNILIIERMQ